MSTPKSESRVLIMGKYELGKLLGHGSSAKVYHARNTSTGHSVAIKVINKSRISSSPSSISSIKREISAMSRLRHPHVVSLLEVLATRTHIFLAMDLARGGELFNAAARGRFTEHLTRRCFRQLISAVAYCHSRGVFHRDLKLENLLLDHNGDIKVSDFGLCAVTSPNRSLSTLCGTPAYVAPEILAGSSYNGAAVDVWSCGVILFALVAGYLPFNDTSLVALYRKIGRGEFRCPRWMSAGMKRLMGRMLDTNPESRITVEGIMKDPWLGGGLEEDGGFGGLREVKMVGFGEGGRMNAFDIISFSQGLDLSGMFSVELWEEEGLFLVEKGGEEVVGRVEEVCGGGGLVVERNGEGGMVVGERNGDFLVGIQVHRITEEVAFLEVRRRGGTPCLEWKVKVWPEICGLLKKKVK